MKWKSVVWSIFLLLFVTACSNDPKEKLAGRTVLVYIAADNNLSDYAFMSINNLVAGAEGDNLNNGNLLVYIDSSDDLPQLIQVKKGNGDVILKEMVKTYEEHNSASPEIMRSVLDDVFKNEQYKADSYGLILWSHATAWLPSDYKNYLRSFGEDNGNQMEIHVLRDALRGYHFDFLLFDACYMGSIEVVYALRDNADYIVSSPTETLAYSFPYREIVAYLFADGSVKDAMRKTSEAFYNYYNSMNGDNRSATVSLVETAALPQLAETTRKILSGREEDAFAISVNDLQLLEYLRHTDHALYDFGDYVKQMASEDQYAEFKQRLEEAVIYKETTDYSFYALIQRSLPVDRDRFCGLSSYVPQSRLEKLNDWYKDLDWYKAVY